MPGRRGIPSYFVYVNVHIKVALVQNRFHAVTWFVSDWLCAGASKSELRSARSATPAMWSTFDRQTASPESSRSRLYRAPEARDTPSSDRVSVHRVACTASGTGQRPLGRKR